MLIPNVFSCSNCNKKIYVSNRQWAYKNRINNKINYFCCWGCLREFEKKTGITKLEKKEKKKIEKELEGKSYDYDGNFINRKYMK